MKNKIKLLGALAVAVSLSSTAFATSVQIKGKVLKLEGYSATVLMQKLKAQAALDTVALRTTPNVVQFRTNPCAQGPSARGNEFGGIGKLLSCQNIYETQCAPYPTRITHSCSLIFTKPLIPQDQAETRALFDLLPGNAEYVTDEGIMGAGTYSKSFGGILCTKTTVIYPGAVPKYSCSNEETTLEDFEPNVRNDVSPAIDSGRPSPAPRTSSTSAE